MSRRVVLVALAGAVVLLLLWFVLLWGPQGGRLSDAEDRLEVAEGQNRALELRLARLQAAQERAPALAVDLEELRQAVPDDPSLAEFILEANRIATESGVDFLSIAPGVPEAGTGALPPTVTLNLVVSGSYFSVLEYLSLLEDLPRIVVVDSLNLTPVEGGGLSVSITGRMFSTSAPQLVDPGAAPTAATATSPSTTTEPPTESAEP